MHFLLKGFLKILADILLLSAFFDTLKVRYAEQLCLHNGQVFSYYWGTIITHMLRLIYQECMYQLTLNFLCGHSVVYNKTSVTFIITTLLVPNSISFTRYRDIAYQVEIK